MPAAADLASSGVDRDREGLSERDLKVLEFERHWWKYDGSKEQAIKELFGMSSTRYYQVLNGLLDDPRQLGILQHVGLAYRLAEGRGCGLDASDRLDGRTEGITGPLGDSEDPQRHPGRPRIFLDGHVAGQAQHHP